MANETLALPNYDEPQWERILAFHNPHSSSQDVIRGHLAQLRQNFAGRRESKITVIETRPSVTANIEVIGNELRPTDAIMVAGGDGTFSQVAQAVRVASPNSATTTLGGGNANDNAHMLHAQAFLRHAPSVFTEGSVAPLTPLAIKAEHPDLDAEQVSLSAFAYFSVGFSAEMAERFNERPFREAVADMSAVRRLLVEGASTYRTFNHAQPFTIHDQAGTRQLTELAFPNGSRMAKKLRFGLHLLDAQAGRLEVKRPSKAELAMVLGRAALGKFTKFGPGESYSFTAEALGGVIVQADGETHVYPSGTTFTVSLDEQPVQVITTRWHYNPPEAA